MNGPLLPWVCESQPQNNGPGKKFTNSIGVGEFGGRSENRYCAGNSGTNAERNGHFDGHYVEQTGNPRLYMTDSLWLLWCIKLISNRFKGMIKMCIKIILIYPKKWGFYKKTCILTTTNT